MKFQPLETLPEVVLIDPVVNSDERGFFLECYHSEKFAEGGIEARFVQDNHSLSTQGTLRGLHAQRTHPQGKLVRAIEGEIFDVAVDIRPASPTFGRWEGAFLSAENFRLIYVPPGFAHGFCVVSKRAQVQYKCTDLYRPDDEIVIAWNDPDIGVEWPVEDPILSNRDRAAPQLAELDLSEA